MADYDDLLLDGEGDDGEDGNPEDMDIDITPREDDEPEPAAPAAPSASEEVDEPEAAPPEPASVDFSKIPADEIMKLFDREDVRERILQAEPVRRVIQSEKDKEIARHERQLKDEQKRKNEEERAKSEAETRERLAEDQDYAALGELDAKKIREDKQLSAAASRVAGVIEGVVRKHPDFARLGEEKIEDIHQSVLREGGNAIDFTLKLAEERRRLDVEEATAATTKTLDDRIKAEVEAALAAAGVEMRSEQVAEGKTPSKSISGGGAPKTASKQMTFAEAETAYGEGDMPWSEYQPFWEEHERKRQA